MTVEVDRSTARPAADTVPVVVTSRPRVRRSARRFWSPLTLRILALNMLPLLVLFGGAAYLDRYQKSLVQSELDALQMQAGLIAIALGENAITVGSADYEQLSTESTQGLLRRLVSQAPVRARVFAPTGELIADSRVLAGSGGTIEVELLAPPVTPDPWDEALSWVYDLIFAQLPRQHGWPPYEEQPRQRAEHYDEARAALRGDTGRAVRLAASGDLVISAAVPVQKLKQVLGVLMLSTQTTWIDEAVRSVRFDILRFFGIALLVTILASLYLAGAIARPIRRLAMAAERVRAGHRRRNAIPDFSRRGDEIGDLSVSLRAMTEALSSRIDAIERFAADVAHEIKNPLTSVRSAVETAIRLDDPEKQKRLMAIVLEDVQRLDRLISDISHASRIDAELSRAELESVDVGRMLATLVEMHETTAEAAENGERLRLALDVGPNRGLTVLGLEDRLVQVFRNLVTNALSFSPPRGTVMLACRGDADWVTVTVEDQGPGIPESKLTAIFDRFYTERPKGERFGTHSGLGLSISKQIVEAHDGTIHADNRRDASGRVAGARFVVRLPRR
ncbi:MAG: HAMP domain-containing protein [Alphaproteobacteria bacterium]|nr:HAMP domain-containing protein [Alphaproteobacteria bacterium]